MLHSGCSVFDRQMDRHILTHVHACMLSHTHTYRLCINSLQTLHSTTLYYMHTCMHAYMYIHINTCTYTYTNVDASVYVCVNIYIERERERLIETHTHTRARPKTKTLHPRPQTLPKPVLAHDTLNPKPLNAKSQTLSQEQKPKPKSFRSLVGPE